MKLTCTRTRFRRFPFPLAPHILPHILQSKTAQFAKGKRALAAVLKGHGAVAVVVAAVNVVRLLAVAIPPGNIGAPLAAAIDSHAGDADSFSQSIERNQY